MFEDMVDAAFIFPVANLMLRSVRLEDQSMEELANEELQLLQEIHDMLVALVDKIDAQKRELDSIEKHRERPVRDRQAMLIERIRGRYDATSAEFLDHVPYLVKRVYRIHRAGKPKRTTPQASATARSRAASSCSLRA
jgi:iron-sulfur cluster repair protein YtfE (RIC family)